MQSIGDARRGAVASIETCLKNCAARASSGVGWYL